MANELSKLADRIEVDEQLAKIAPNLQKANDAGEFLGKIAESAKAHFDSRREPYPPHLNSLLSFLGARAMKTPLELDRITDAARNAKEPA